jgi:mersacidin/lichenicidin family type 2 lantibiotic
MNINSTRVWKNSLYRTTSANEELTQLPENPIGTLELTDEDLIAVAGACGGCDHGFGDGGWGLNGFGDGGFAFRRRVYGFNNFGDGGCGCDDGGFGLGGHIILTGHIILGGGCQ